MRRVLGRLRGAPARAEAQRAARRAVHDLDAIAAAGTLDTAWVARQADAGLDAAGAVRWLLETGVARGASCHPLVELSLVADRVPETLRGEVDAAQAHPLLASGRQLSAALADPARSLVPGADLPRWREVVDLAQSVLDEERALEGNRLRSSWDETADAAYVARWSSAAGPVASGPWATVVMPVRNRPEAVVRAIRSVQAQTLDAWQLVVVDDGSTDGTPDVVAALAADDARITLLRREPEGVCAARNAGIAAAAAPYTAFLDSDNQWTPAFLRTAVAALHASGSAVGHAVVDEQSDRGHRYRAFDGQEPHLRTGNFVDLNVLVVRTDALRAIGGFDPSLRRMVDYDLVWRLAKEHHLELLPFVGVRYAAQSHLSDRISATESFAWDDVVKSRHLAGAAPSDLDPDLVSVVVPHRGDRAAARATVGSVLAALDVVEVLLVDLASPAPDWRLLHAEVGLDPRVRLLRSPGPLDRAAGAALGAAAATGRRLVVVPSGAVVEPEALRSLVDALDAAAIASPPGGSGVVAARAEDYRALGGLDPLLTDEHEVDDLQLRAQARGLEAARIETPLDVVRPWPAPSDSRHADNVREWERRWPGVAPGSTP